MNVGRRSRSVAVAAAALLVSSLLVATSASSASAQPQDRWTVDRTCSFYYEQVRARSKSTSGQAWVMHEKAQSHSVPGNWTLAGVWFPVGTATKETWHYFGTSKQWTRLTNNDHDFSHKSAICIDTGIR
jgi:hypothetical protein